MSYPRRYPKRKEGIGAKVAAERFALLRELHPDVIKEISTTVRGTLRAWERLREEFVGPLNILPIAADFHLDPERAPKDED